MNCSKVAPDLSNKVLHPHSWPSKRKTTFARALLKFTEMVDFELICSHPQKKDVKDGRPEALVCKHHRPDDLLHTGRFL